MHLPGTSTPQSMSLNRQLLLERMQRESSQHWPRGSQAQQNLSSRLNRTLTACLRMGTMRTVGNESTMKSVYGTCKLEYKIKGQDFWPVSVIWGASLTLSTSRVCISDSYDFFCT